MTTPSHIIIKFQGSMKLSLQNEKIKNCYSIKEKFGELRIYDAGAPKEVHDIICKYELYDCKGLSVDNLHFKRFLPSFLSFKLTEQLQE